LYLDSAEGINVPAVQAPPKTVLIVMKQLFSTAFLYQFLARVG